jgi:ABC-type nitrate/sulfonate/bicarbonate transport system substrate-binding protein
LGIQQEIRFVGTGGIRQDIAALRARATDASVMGLGIMLRVKLAGEIRELVNVSDYLPKNWLDHVIYAHSDFARKQPGQLKSAVRAILEASAFIKKNPRWAKDKMRAMSGYTQGQAEFMFKNLGLTSDGAVRNETVEKIRAFAIEYDLITKEKTPPVAKFFTTRFLP